MAAETDSKNRKKRKPNVFDVARLAGVSQTTVSFVLNNRGTPRIPEETTKRVLDAVAQLGYRRNTIARSLAHGKTMTVGMVLSSFDGDFHGVIMRACQAVLTEQDYQLLFMYAEPGSAKESKIIQFFLEHRVDAMLCFAHDYSVYVVPEWLADIREEGIAGVLVDSVQFSDHIDSVGSDDIEGMYKGVKHLYDLGHRKICLISQNWEEDLLPDRVRGYGVALARLGLDYDVRLALNRESRPSDISAEMAKILQSSDAPTAFVTYNDYVFEDFLMNQAGSRFRVPEDVSLVGYGNLYLSRFAKLTSVSQHPEARGRSAAECILSRLAQPDQSPRKIEIEPELVVRSTTAPPRSQ